MINQKWKKKNIFFWASLRAQEISFFARRFDAFCLINVNDFNNKIPINSKALTFIIHFWKCFESNKLTSFERFQYNEINTSFHHDKMCALNWRKQFKNVLNFHSVHRIKTRKCSTSKANARRKKERRRRKKHSESQ